MEKYKLINDSTAKCLICGSESGWGYEDDEDKNLQTVTIHCPECGDLEYTHEIYYPIEITCHLCGHLWTYTGKSTARYINCYQCGGKVKNPYFKNPKGE